MYVIQFLYNTFILPPGLVLWPALFLTIWLFRQRQRQATIALGLVTLLLYLTSLPLLADILIGSLESRYSPPQKVSGDCIVVLGGGATLDTPNLGFKGHPGGSSANRLLTAVQLYTLLKVPIIISGGQVYADMGNEAQVDAKILTSLHVPAEMIIQDSTSLNTAQNAQNVKVLLQRHHFRNPILVTSALHMPRSVQEFNRLGMHVTPFPTDYLRNLSHDFQFKQLLPSNGAMGDIGRAMKEYIGIVAIGIR